MDTWPGTTSTNIDNTTGNITGNTLDYYYPWTYPYPYPNTIYFAPTVTNCAGDIHVFPCPHCDVCKCGKAKLKK